MHQRPEGSVRARLLRARLLQAFVLTALCLGCLLPAACRRDADGQLPAVSGEKITAKRATVQGFGLVAAYPDQAAEDELALALEFSRPLVGTQAFDQLLAVTDRNGASVKGSWVLDDEDNRLLRFPHVRAGTEYVVTIKGGLTAADGDRIGREVRRSINTGPLHPRPVIRAPVLVIIIRPDLLPTMHLRRREHRISQTRSLGFACCAALVGDA
jgi:hypothetical protein